MNSLERKKYSLFQILKAQKERFCNIIAIRFDVIVRKCLAKRILEKAEEEQENVEYFKQSAVAFSENKDRLHDLIMKIQNENIEYRKSIESLFISYINNDYATMEIIFKKHGFLNKKGLNSES